MLDNYSLNALVVDDYAAMRSLMKRQLMDIGVSRAAEAPNAAMALDKLRAEQFNLLLLDYYLGDATDGQQLLELIRTERLIPSSAVVIMVTADSDYAAVARVAEHTPDSYLLKPFTADRLLAKLTPLILRKMGQRGKNATRGLSPIYDQYDAGQYVKALAMLDGLRAAEGIKQDTARLRGDCLLKLRAYPSALEHFQSLAATSPWAHLGLAHALQGLGRREEALSELKNLVRSHASYFPAADALAAAYSDLNQHEQALQVLEAAAQRSPTVARMRTAGITAERSGNDEASVKWLTRVVNDNKHAAEQEPMDTALLVRGLVKTGQLDKAAGTLAMAIKANPALVDDPDIQSAQLLSQATTYHQARIAAETEGAISVRERRLAMLEGQVASIKRLADQVAASNGNGRGVLLAGEALMAAGLQDHAEEKLAQALAAGGVIPHTLGSEEWRAQMWSKAHIAAGKAGLDHMRAGDFHQAITVFARLAEQMSDAAPALANLIQAIAALEKAGKAREADIARGEAALARLHSEYPDYPRLAAVAHAWERRHQANAEEQLPPGAFLSPSPQAPHPGLFHVRQDG